MTLSAQIICDSISESGDRLTTYVVTAHRYILAEINTHRVLCLAGDSVLEFDLPSALGEGNKRVYRMTIADFVNKWSDGANRIETNPKYAHDLTWINPEEWYFAQDISDRLQFAKTAIHLACRKKLVEARKIGVGKDAPWQILGSSFISWRASKPEHARFSIKDRLSGMKIRQLNEVTGLIQSSNVVNCTVSGVKSVYEVRAGKFKIAGSLDHLIYTSAGWRTIKDLRPGDDIVVRKFGKKQEDLLGPRFAKIGGVYRSQWQRQKKSELLAIQEGCSKCEGTKKLEVHHIVPVYIDPSLAFIDNNVILLCEDCHEDQHRVQGWQGGTYLYGDIETISEIVYRGEEETYDLEIAGEFPNFIANGVVVHNSKSSASSRAIPVRKQLERVRTGPAWPVAWPAEQAGMQGGAALSEASTEAARAIWADAAEDAVLLAERLVEVGVHKSVVNRLLEPFMYHTMVITGTAYKNFFALRANPLAQPEFKVIAEMMQAEYEKSKPQELQEGEWHLPFLDGDEDSWLDIDRSIKVSVARCARVSYLTHEGKRDPAKDLELYDRLVSANPMHSVPLEHAATPNLDNKHTVELPTLSEIELILPRYGNFLGWHQHRFDVEATKGYQAFS